MTCPNCGSSNVNVQVVTETQLKKKRHSFLWWLFVGWWWVPIKWLFFTWWAILAKIFAPKRQTLHQRHISKCVCQNCGYTWDAKPQAVQASAKQAPPKPKKEKRTEKKGKGKVAAQPKYLPGDDVPLPATREDAYIVAPQWMKIIQESATLCNSTVNPETFFSRYDLMEQYLRRLAAIEHLLSFSGNLPSGELQKMSEGKPAAIHDMIDRSYQRMIQEARALKTPKGQEARLLKYFNTMEGFEEELGPDGIAYVLSLKERHIVR